MVRSIDLFLMLGLLEGGKGNVEDEDNLNVCLCLSVLMYQSFIVGDKPPRNLLGKTTVL